MAAAFLELHKTIHGRICQHGLQAMLAHTRKTTIELQAIEITGLKRKLAELEQQRDCARDHCSDLHDRCHDLEEGIWAIQNAIQETYPAAFKLVKKYSKKDARRVVAGLDDAISSIIHLCSDNESDFG